MSGEKGSSVDATVVGAWLALCLVASTATGAAQDLEPKAYSASPVGAAFLVAGVTRSTGSVLTDPTLPLTDIEAAINSVPIAAGYTFGLFGKLALVTAAVPYAWGDVSGQVGEEARAVTRSGLADSRLKLSINLAGNPAMGLREFVEDAQEGRRGDEPDGDVANQPVRRRQAD